MLTLLPLAAHALPMGGATSSGVAHGIISGSALTIEQGTRRAVIDWRSFDVGPDESVTFKQPSASAAILNRIHDANPSEISGKLSANGTVVLSNPNGMLFGAGAQVDVGGLIATTANIEDDAFMTQDRLSFHGTGNPQAAIVNHGSITAKEAGLVALVAPSVENHGVIMAKAGKVALAAGERFTYDLYGDGLVSISSDADVSLTHTGTIAAQGGQVLLTAAEAGTLVNSAINVDGVVNASNAYAKGGEIVITGEGADVTLGSGSVLNASGKTGGGTIKVGGDYLGQGDIPKASTTTIADGAYLTADATDKGDGGRVIVWSEGKTVFGGVDLRSNGAQPSRRTSAAGQSALPMPAASDSLATHNGQRATISAKGGVNGGNGGFVETSSRNTLSADGRVDASSPHGMAGQWLLDPNNITIQAAGGNTNVSASPNFSSTNDNAIVTTGSIEAALNAGTSVIVATTSSGANAQSGDITVSGAIAKTAGGNATLTLQADNSIFVNSSITSTAGTLGIVLHADKDSSGAGSVTVTGATLTTNGGNLTIGGGVNPALNPAIGTAANDDGVTINNSTLTTGAGNISIRGKGRDNAGTANQYGAYVYNGSQVQTTTGTITLNGTGGNGTSGNYGVRVSGAGTGITSTDSAISLIGQGGNGSSSSNYGIFLNNDPDITSTGVGANAATITLDGTGGAGTTDNYGVIINSAGTLITSVDGAISVTGQGGNGSGASNYGIYVQTDADILSTGTGADAATITLDGTGGDGTSSNHGVVVQNTGTLISSVDGDISITGTGGNGSAGSNYGIYMLSDADITSTGTGADAATITLSGTGGNGTSNNYGVRISNAGTLLTSVDGNISLTGTGGNGSSSSNYGIYFTTDADITSTGTGANAATITLSGTGGGGTSSNIGIRLSNAGSLITSVDGDISLTGIGGNGSSSSNYGVFLDADADVTSTGTGADAATITLEGTGGNGTSGNVGVDMVNAGSALTSVDGDISVTGTGGNGSSTNNDGIQISIDTAVTSTGSADITLTGTAGANASSEDIQTLTGANVIGGGAAAGNITLNMNNHSLVNLSVQTTGDIILQPRSAGTTVGVAGGAGALDISAAVLAFMNWGDTLRIGRTDGAGAVTVNAHDFGGKSGELRSGAGVISINGAQTNLADFTLTTDADPVFASTADGVGTLTLQTSAAATTFGFDGGAGTVNYSGADLAQLGTNWNAYQIGSTTATGAHTINAHTWADPVTFRSAAGGNTAVTGNQQITGASNGSFTFTGPVTLSADIDTTNGAGAAQNLTFPAAVTLGGNSHLDVGGGDILFSGTLDGAFDLELTTTNDITFSGAVGGITPLAAVTVDPRHLTSGAFNAASFTLTGGTGNITFNGAGLDTTGNIAIATTGNITGTYSGTNGDLDAGAGAINATTTFQGLNIAGASATLLAGNIGVTEFASQAMANRITINNILYPTPDPNYTFAGYIIGTPLPTSSGSNPAPGTPPVSVPPPATPQAPSVPEAPPVGTAVPITGIPPQIASLPGITPDILRHIITFGLQTTPVQEKDIKREAIYISNSRHQKAADTSTGSQLLHYSEQLLDLLGCKNDGDQSCERLRWSYSLPM